MTSVIWRLESRYLLPCINSQTLRVDGVGKGEVEEAGQPTPQTSETEHTAGHGGARCMCRRSALPAPRLLSPETLWIGVGRGSHPRLLLERRVGRLEGGVGREGRLELRLGDGRAHRHGLGGLEGLAQLGLSGGGALPLRLQFTIVSIIAGVSVGCGSVVCVWACGEVPGVLLLGLPSPPRLELGRQQSQHRVLEAVGMAESAVVRDGDRRRRRRPRCPTRGGEVVDAGAGRFASGSRDAGREGEESACSTVSPVCALISSVPSIAATPLCSTPMYFGADTGVGPVGLSRAGPGMTSRAAATSASVGFFFSERRAARDIVL